MKIYKQTKGGIDTTRPTDSQSAQNASVLDKINAVNWLRIAVYAIFAILCFWGYVEIFGLSMKSGIFLTLLVAMVVVANMEMGVDTLPQIKNWGIEGIVFMLIALLIVSIWDIKDPIGTTKKAISGISLKSPQKPQPTPPPKWKWGHPKGILQSGKNTFVLSPKQQTPWMTAPIGIYDIYLPNGEGDFAVYYNDGSCVPFKDGETKELPRKQAATFKIVSRGITDQHFTITVMPRKQ